ncbi:hypothetical protein SAMN06295905_0851 [Devosia lucknowensis]|uniref:Uncharacterized protein n=1 Tax=Devosia lucknowensis TaxID=1096929 RepID=A0A1Y6ELY8_9HYPH|nr:hypothetical protein [Devosia lucknowensis]SMQ63664.1 hypothetical protein SAMN06295905_0851 [Devosia lucknowensis]
MTKPSKPAPAQTAPGTQKDDNIDDMGRRPDGSEQDQPVNGSDGKPVDDKPAR